MTVDELLGRMTSSEITEWLVFFEMQEDELERSQRKARAAADRPQQKPTIGDSAGVSDAITAAREAQGLS